jgi:hypothetical protein
MPLPLCLRKAIGVTLQAVWPHAHAQHWQGAMTTETL